MILIEQYLYHRSGFRETDGHPAVSVIGRNGETNLIAVFKIFPFGVVGAVHFEWITRYGVLPFASAQCRTLVYMTIATPMLMLIT